MAVAVLDLTRRDAPPASAEASSSYVSGPKVRVVFVLQAAILLMFLANIGRIPLVSSGGGKEAPVLLNDIFLITLLAIGAFVALRNRSMTLDRTAGWALSFAAVGGFSAFLALIKFNLSPFEIAFSLAYLARWLAYFGVYLVVINFVSRETVPKVWKALETLLLTFAIFGIFQSAFMPGFAQMVYPDSTAYVDWDIQGRRLVSTFLDPNFAGGLLTAGLLVMLAQLAAGVQIKWWKLITIFTALILTISRSSFLSLAVGGLVLLAVRGLSRRLLRFAGVLLLLMIPATPFVVQYALAFNKFSIDASALARVASWIEAYAILVDNPLLGVGFNTYGFVRGNYGFGAAGMSSFTLDGGLIFIAVMTGAVGVCLYTAMIGSILLRCRRIWSSTSYTAAERGLATGVGAATVALIIHSFFINSLLYPFLMQPFWVLWGLTSVLGAAVSRRSWSDTLTLRNPVVQPLLPVRQDG